MKEYGNYENEILAKGKDCKVSGEKRNYLIFSDAEFDLIYESQKELDVEFTEEEKNFSFL